MPDEGNNLDELIDRLFIERGERATIPDRLEDKRDLLRTLMNIRLPEPIAPDTLKLQDEELLRQRKERGDVSPAALPAIPSYPRIKLWRGDIRRLTADAIVNAANSAMLGCFAPLHNCVDNLIHSAAGMQIREECSKIMAGKEASVGEAIETSAGNLPSRKIYHVVGPRVAGELPTKQDRESLALAYKNCLKLSAKNKDASLAFCCLSTGIFRFPQDEAAKIAINTTKNFLAGNDFPQIVIFDVYTDKDYQIYAELLNYA